MSNALLTKSGIAVRPKKACTMYPILKTGCRFGLGRSITTITKFTAMKGMMHTILQARNNMPGDEKSVTQYLKMN